VQIALSLAMSNARVDGAQDALQRRPCAEIIAGLM
jgi:hypothetical protein